MIILQARLSPADCRAHPERLYVFGDNMERWGTAGQACIRGAPNALGIPTKLRPSMGPDAFLNDDHLDDGPVREAIDAGLGLIAAHHEAGGIVVIPNDGLGTGLAQLPSRAPKLYRYICDRLAALGGV